MPTIDATTRVCAVIGHPIGHSLSPAIHNAAFETCGLPFVYVAHDVLPGNVAAAIEGMRALGYRGLSITIPHKVEAMRCVDEVDPTAEAIGCINTVVNDEGRLRGTNSDGQGALNALREAGADPAGKRVLLLGSGGAARAIAVTMAREAPPAELAILGIEMGELEQLVQDAGERGRCPVRGERLDDDSLRRTMAKADIVLHCTPIGMHPREENSLVPPDLFRSEMTVFDAVYNPRRTRLLNEAASAGCRIVEGLDMFVGQAIVQFELWTGHPAPQDVMRRVVEDNL